MTTFTKTNLWPTVFIGPCLLGLLVFTYGPIVASFGLSFMDWNLLNTPQWVGLQNYQTVLSDPLFWQTLKNTWFFVLASGGLEVVLGLTLAIQLNGLLKGRTVLQTAYFLPYITPMLSVALVWGWLYEPQNGLLNQLVQQLDLSKSPIAWLYTPQTAMAAILLLNIWKGVGYQLVIFLAGLQAIPQTVYESATLDGATPWQIFWRITLPLLTPTLFFVGIVTLINGFQAFDSVYLLTQGGPSHHTELLVYWLFKNAFEFFKIGPASAMAYLLFAMVLGLTLLQWQLRKRWVLYEE